MAVKSDGRDQDHRAEPVDLDAAGGVAYPVANARAV
jgi:hypothetical protein